MEIRRFVHFHLEILSHLRECLYRLRANLDQVDSDEHFPLAGANRRFLLVLLEIQTLNVPNRKSAVATSLGFFDTDKISPISWYE